MLTVFVNGTVWTGVRTPVGVYTTHALAVRDGRVLAIGEAAANLRSDAVEVIDLQGGFLMSAFGDGHAHPLQAGVQETYAKVRDADSIEAAVAAVKTWADANPDAEWVRGDGFHGTLAPGGLFDATWLDAAVPDRPALLRANDYHTAWVNTKAIELLGFDANSPDPADGEFVRRPDGSLMGTLREWGAWRPFFDRLPPATQEQRIDLVRHASRELNRRGIVWVQDAWVEQPDIEAYIDALDAGALTFRANLALLAEPETWATTLDWVRESCGRIADLGDPRLRAVTLKFFADGVVEQGTAAMIDEYCDCPGSHGLHRWRPEQLRVAVAETEAAGFQVHIHAIGDAGVRSALDAFEHSLLRNGSRGFPPIITHAQVVQPSDLRRFAELGVVANFQPLWACYDDCQRDLTSPRLGPERTAWQYPIGTLLNGGASVSFGSDWPVSSHNPLEGIAVAITRQDLHGDDLTPLVADEAIDIESALLAYTQGVAYQAAQHLDWGLLRVGARADLAWLPVDPRAVDPSDLAGIDVVGTWLGGTRVWG